MKIAHTALWTQRLEELREFYVRYFGAAHGRKYVNPAKGFESYMLSFGEGCQLELMRKTDVVDRVENPALGFCHIAFDCETPEAVHRLTEQLRADGYHIVGEPRTTGDGFFESVVADPDGNTVEIVAE